MKLKNAPRRKQLRQISALERLSVSKEKDKPYPKTKKGKHEMKVLAERVKGNARNVRTKKSRAGKGVKV